MLTRGIGMKYEITGEIKLGIGKRAFNIEVEAQSEKEGRDYPTR